MNLYDIDAAILACVDNETGEVLDAYALDALMMERETKLENLCLWIRNLQAEIDALADEEERLAFKRKYAERKMESLKGYLSRVLDGQKFKTNLCNVTFRPSNRVIVRDVDALPTQFRRVKTIVEPDKAALRTALKAGQEVPGAELDEYKSMILR